MDTQEHIDYQDRIYRNNLVFDNNIWYVPPAYSYFKIATSNPPITQISLNKRDRNNFWHLQYWTMIDSREVEQYTVNSCGMTSQEQVHRLYLFCTRSEKSNESLFTQAIWGQLIHDILCLKSKRLYFDLDLRYSTREYADTLLRWISLRREYGGGGWGGWMVGGSISETQLYTIVDKWDKILTCNHPNYDNLFIINTGFSPIIFEDYRLPFLQDEALLIKITRLYELRALRVIILSSTLANSPFAFLGGKPMLCHWIASYLIGYLQW